MPNGNVALREHGFTKSATNKYKKMVKKLIIKNLYGIMLQFACGYKQTTKPDTNDSLL